MSKNRSTLFRCCKEYLVVIIGFARSSSQAFVTSLENNGTRTIKYLLYGLEMEVYHVDNP